MALTIIATILYVVTCLFLIMVVLLRKSEGSSLGSAFGVGGESPFGVKTQQALDKIAIYATVLFFALAIFLSRRDAGAVRLQIDDLRLQGG